MRRSRQHRVVRALLALGLAVLASGCRLDAVVDVALERDGAGELSVELVADRALLTRASASGVDPLADLAARVAELDGWDVGRDGTDGGGRRVRLTAGFSGPEAFNALVAGFAAAVNAPELRPLEGLTLERDGDRLLLRGVAALQPAAAVEELGVSAEQAVSLLAEHVGYQVRVTLPGEVIDTNADRSADGVLRWQVPAGQRAEILAEGAVPPGRLAPLVAGGVLAAMVTALWLRRRALP